MRKNNANLTSGPPSPELRQVDALLHLLQDVGYDVETGPAGQWIVSSVDRAGRRRVVGVDSARKVASVATALSDALQVDRDLLTSCAHAHAG